MSEVKDMVTLPKKLYAKIFFQLDDEQLQRIFDNASSEELEVLRELRKKCA